MNSPSLTQLYADHHGKVSDKWSSYLTVYGEAFAPYRHAPVRLLEVGIQNGGSLEIWAKYFANATLLLGCDIDERCGGLSFADPRIRVVVGDAAEAGITQEIGRHAVDFDIVLDDGSHRSRDIVTTFARLFPLLSHDGVYVAEDLHCSYWRAYQGGLFDPDSSESFFKRLADIIQHEHWGIPGQRADLIASFRERYGCAIEEEQLACIHSVEFRNSVCVVRKRKPSDVELGTRIVAGDDTPVSDEMLQWRGTRASAQGLDERTNPWSQLNETKDRDRQREHQRAQQELAAVELERQQKSHAEQIEAMRAEHARSTDLIARNLRSFELTAQQRQQELHVLSRLHERQAARLRAVQEAHAALLASRSWKIVSALQRAAHRMPRLTRWSWQMAKVLRLVSTLQFGRVAQAAVQRYRARNVAAAVAGSGLFDEQFYLSTYPDVAAYPGGPLLHYVLLGGLEGRRPNAMFDGLMYLHAHPEVRSAGENPVIHYLHHSDLNPNPYFDGLWYRNENPDVKASGLNPLRHYMEFGAAEGRDPSSRFSTRWYVDRNPDIAASRMNPLAHFLLHGKAEGRSPSPESFFASSGASVTRSEIHCLKAPPLGGGEVALFVAHSPDGKLKPHVLHYLRSLKKAGISIVLLAAADAAFVATDEISATVSGIFVRRNEGYDFAFWAHVLKLRPDLLDAEILYLLNDSLIGPFNQKAFEALLGRVRKSAASVVGMTSNHERTGWHLQSYFLALKHEALASVAFQTFFNRVTTLDDKDDVINQYELRFAPYLRSEGLSCEALFDATGESNPTIYEWKQLIEKGMPFVKVMVLRDRFDNVDTSDWEQVLREEGFDPALAARTLEEAKRPATPPVRNASLVTQPSLPFDPPPRRLKVALIGPWNFDNGLGVAARSYISALRRTGVLLNLHPIKRPFHIHRQIAPPVDICDFSGDADVVVVQLNPEGWDTLLNESQLLTIRQARCRVGAWVWETPDVPDQWLDVMKRVDMIWAPSQYCADAFARAVDVPVHVVPYVVSAGVPLEAGVARSAMTSLELDVQQKIVLYAFDGSSYLVRKNPLALVEAFAKSRLHEAGWTLVLKTKHVQEATRQGIGLIELAARTPGVTLLNRSLDKNAMRALMGAAAIYASPHRAEGFGLTVAEAMAMGKIVIATDFSGTRDFLDASCGFPVPFRNSVLSEDHGAYKTGVNWASVDVDQLTRALVAAARAVDEGDHTLGDAARAQVGMRLSMSAVAEAMNESLQEWVSSHGVHLPGDARK